MCAGEWRQTCVTFHSHSPNTYASWPRFCSKRSVVRKTIRIYFKPLQHGFEQTVLQIFQQEQSERSALRYRPLHVYQCCSWLQCIRFNIMCEWQVGFELQLLLWVHTSVQALPPLLIVLATLNNKIFYQGQINVVCVCVFVCRKWTKRLTL